MNLIELDTELCKQLPPWYREVLDYQQMCQTETAQFEALAAEITGVADNFFFQTMGLDGIEMWEQIFHIVPNPQTEDIDFRRYRVLNRITTKPPFTLGFLYQKLDQMLGEGRWEVDVDYPNYGLTIDTPLQNTLYEGELRHMVHVIKPAHIDFSLRYREVAPSPVYVGSVTRQGLVEVTWGVETPVQGAVPAFAGAWSRKADRWISITACNRPIQIKAGFLMRRAEREVSTWDFHKSN